MRAILHEAHLFALYNHSSGFFGEVDALWRSQSNERDLAAFPGDDFWQLNLFAGYRFLQRRAEARVGLLNVNDQDYRLHPLNLTAELPRDAH
jgi:outer membrane receptor protein involved in Fe transport